ncbi:hypothetical protein B0H15DRAFT_927230 [Mycena belliarum]|uniref:C2H2-type domain-containing protein n=1 Tax=Mycena belliarum TaxID=1033014 RepID=A0AAD6XV15_9AGAR|nr:hypothetical protein B0H15DRAFT_927230 [Mycena belliae]
MYPEESDLTAYQLYFESGFDPVESTSFVVSGDPTPSQLLIKQRALSTRPDTMYHLPLFATRTSSARSTSPSPSASSPSASSLSVESRSSPFSDDAEGCWGEICADSPLYRNSSIPSTCADSDFSPVRDPDPNPLDGAVELRQDAENDAPACTRGLRATSSTRAIIPLPKATAALSSGFTFNIRGTAASDSDEDTDSDYEDASAAKGKRKRASASKRRRATSNSKSRASGSTRGALPKRKQKASPPPSTDSDVDSDSDSDIFVARDILIYKFICPAVGCSRRFKTSGGVMRHHDSTHGGVFILCPLCSKRFSGNRTDSLGRHLANKQACIGPKEEKRRLLSMRPKRVRT